MRSADAAVLRQALLGDVELGHDLQARDQRRVQRLVGLHHLAQRAVDAKAHRARALVGLDVDVARAVLGGLREQRVEHADDRRVVGRLQQVLHRRQLLHHARQVDAAFHLADDHRRARLAAGVGRGDALRERGLRLVLHGVDVVEPLHLRQRRQRRVLVRPQHELRAVVFEQQGVGLGPGVGQGVAGAHGGSPSGARRAAGGARAGRGPRRRGSAAFRRPAARARRPAAACPACRARSAARPAASRPAACRGWRGPAPRRRAPAAARRSR